MQTLLIALVVATTAAVAALVALVVSSARNASERRKLVDSYEATEDSFQERITTLSSEKAALESRLAAREDYERSLEQIHDKALAAQKETAAEELKRQAEVHEKALRVQEEAHEKALRTQEETHKRVLRAQEEQLGKNLEAMSDAFKALSAQNSETFRNKSKEEIAEILGPIREKFAEFDKSVRESQKDSAAQSAALKVHIENVLRQSRTVGDEARNLADALVGRSKVQGDFGEMLLVDVLNNAGLVEGIHYTTQGAMTDERGREIKSQSGRTMIPDVMVHYPDGTTVIVDSKVSLKAYRDHALSESVEERARSAKDHVESVRRHVDELKAKDYASYIPEGRRKVGYNIMFIPVEGAFRLMLEESPTLWQMAKDNNVLIVSQMTLVIVLNMIQMAWKQADQERNIAEVYKTAEELMGQLSGWMASYAGIGAWLDKAREAYAESTRKLKDSNQSVIRKIQKLERLGLAPKRSQARIRPGSRLATIQSSSRSIVPPELVPESDPDPAIESAPAAEPGPVASV